MSVSNLQSLRNAVKEMKKYADCVQDGGTKPTYSSQEVADVVATYAAKVEKALEDEDGVWQNGYDYEYEFAYCSKCGHMQYMGWESHDKARELVPTAHEEYRFCPHCGTRMTGGEYIEEK